MAAHLGAHHVRRHEERLDPFPGQPVENAPERLLVGREAVKPAPGVVEAVAHDRQIRTARNHVALQALEAVRGDVAADARVDDVDRNARVQHGKRPLEIVMVGALRVVIGVN